MAIGVGFANDEYYEKSIEDYYEEELADAPIGASGFVADICYERAIERYIDNHTEYKKGKKYYETLDRRRKTRT